jgi:type I restriction enzyme S subunit
VARIESLAARIEEASGVRKQSTEEIEALVPAAISGALSGCRKSVQLQHAVNPKRPITYGIVQAGEHIPDGIPYIRVSDMAKPNLTLQGMLKTSPSIAAKYDRSKVRTGDIVFAIRATVGKMRFVPPELDGANLTQGTARIAPTSAATGPFLFWALQSRLVVDALNESCKGSTFREMTLGKLRALEVPLPPPEEQRRIVAYLDGVQAKVDALKKLQGETAAELAALLPSILDKAFKGQL